MKKSLKHLPKSKIQELKKIADAIHKSSSDVEMIILFGSYARGGYKEAKDLKPKQKSGHISDYDILVVTEKKKSTDKFTSWTGADNLNLSATARIIAHDIENLNISLAEGQYLFTDIKKEGIKLFDSGKYKLARKRKLKPGEKQRIAKNYFEHWFEIAERFYKHFKIDFAEIDGTNFKINSLAAFNLHQAAEHAYKTILLVFTNYNPQEHYLGLLNCMAAEYCSDLLNLFPKKTQKDKDRFKLFDYAYIVGRYDPEYRISKEDLETLEKDVTKLLEITRKVCKKKIGSYE